MDTKSSKAQSCSFGFSDALLGKLAGPYTKVGNTVAKNILGPLPTMASPFAINGAFQRKLRGARRFTSSHCAKNKVSH